MSTESIAATDSREGSPKPPAVLATPTPAVAVPQRVTEFVTIRAPFPTDAAQQCDARAIAGTEVFMNDVRPRTLPLFDSADAEASLVEALSAARAGRVHASYWASPTSFLANIKFGELASRFENNDRLRDYYGDVSGRHIFTRWADEYAIARSIGARAFVFHLIDYHPVDGEWEFTIPPAVVRQAMATITQQFLREMDERGLLDSDSPVIELENAGWGLEFGAQTADDFVEVLGDIWDPHDVLRIGWDINHLVHALGVREGRGAFLLPPEEITPEMARLEQASNGDIGILTEQWIEANVLDPRLTGKVSAIHLSDCVAKSDEFFRNGKLTPAHIVEGSWDERRAQGLALVLEHYDTHVPLGDGALEPAAVKRMIEALATTQPVMLLHELKNSTDLWNDVDTQRRRLWR